MFFENLEKSDKRALASAGKTCYFQAKPRSFGILLSPLISMNYHKDQIVLLQKS